ncbi:MAG: hypothetical protein LQ346_009105 [Caloplaca aetnensis]|nr:MAG: hypothetical protein LQ346_009105 [Caloplaca aetnensis]
MNVSMQDTYNLTWKLCLVARGLAHPRILLTYHPERHAVARDLIAMDQQLAKFYSAADDPRRTDYQAFRDKYAGFISGVGVRYDAGNCLVDTTCEKQFSIPGMTQHQRFEVGMRIPTVNLINHASAEPTHLHALLPSTGAFRIIVFAGPLSSSSDRLQLINSFAPRLQALVDRYNSKTAPRPPPPSLRNGVEHVVADDTNTSLEGRTSSGWDEGEDTSNESEGTSNEESEGKDQDTLVLLETLLLHSGTRDSLALLDLHEVFHPWRGERGWDYGRVFVVGGGGGGGRGVDADVGGGKGKSGGVGDDDDDNDDKDKDKDDNSPVVKDLKGKRGSQQGCGADRGSAPVTMVIVRPDQHVAAIYEMDEGGVGMKRLEGWFNGVLIGE